MNCQECGDTFTAQRSTAKFCCTLCRKAHNNRRAMRGAVMYDAFMALRYDRDGSKEAGLDYTTVCRIAEMFNREDGKEGRGVYVSARNFMQEHGCQVNARHGRV